MNETVATVSPAVLVRLRAETRSEHDAIEQSLDLIGDDLTLSNYRHRLEQFYGFYQPLEDQMRRLDNWLAPWLDAKERVKTPLLAQDLRTLGCKSLDSLPRCSHLPALESAAGYFGCMYVLEGSTLGGQVISRHICEKLGVTSLSGGRFFEGYGRRTGFMWQQFRVAISEFATTSDTQDQVVAAARSTFAMLNRWCQRRNTG